MNSYNLKYMNINSLSEIKQNIPECIHYQYNNIQFAFKHVENSNKIVIAFHGAAKPTTHLPIFRFPHTQTSSPYTFLSIFDNLLDVYKKNKLLLAWFQDTKKYPNNNNLYSELIKYILDTFRNNNTKVIFYGTSGGGFPALKFSSIFKATCLISNIQVYLHKYRYFIELNNILKKNNDELIIEHIEDFFQKYGLPERIVYYSNTRDEKHYIHHTLPFVEYLCKINATLDLHIFTGDINAKSHHEVQFDTCRKKIIMDL